MSVQRIVEDSPAIELQAEAQHTSGEIETPVCSFSPTFPPDRSAVPDDYCLYFLLATFRIEIRSNLFVETDALGERRLANANDAERSTSTQFDIFGAAVR